jgi:hypothetical protein
MLGRGPGYFEDGGSYPANAAGKDSNAGQPKNENPKRVIVTTNNEEYDVPDPKMYVTKVINPEKEVQRKLMAMDLKNALKDQMQANKRKKEEERQARINEDLKAEERWRREKEAAGLGDDQIRRKGRAFVLPPSPGGAAMHAKKDRNRGLDPNSDFNPHAHAGRGLNADADADANPAAGKDEEEEEDVNKAASPPSQTAMQNRLDPTADSEEQRFRSERRLDHGIDLQLKQLQSEMAVKENEFNSELDKLKKVAYDSKNARDEADLRLARLKEHIMQKPDYGLTHVFGSPPAFGLGAQHSSIHRVEKHRSVEKASNMGRFSKLYFTGYSKSLGLSAKQFHSDEPFHSRTFKTKADTEEFLAGDSQMIPWRSKQAIAQRVLPPKKPALGLQRFVVSDSFKRAGNSTLDVPAKTTYQRLDDLMKEFLNEEQADAGLPHARDKVTTGHDNTPPPKLSLDPDEPPPLEATSQVQAIVPITPFKETNNDNDKDKDQDQDMDKGPELDTNSGEAVGHGDTRPAQQDDDRIPREPDTGPGAEQDIQNQPDEENDPQ